MHFEQAKTIDQIIIKSCALHFGRTIKEFTEPTSKDFSLAYERFVCVFLLREKTHLAYPRIAEFFNRKESAAKHGYRTISGLEAIKDRRTIADIKEINVIIDNFTNVKKQQYA
jgi:chromosomal replication initiation ATPase DnaA